jgi:hypothetical protein
MDLMCTGAGTATVYVQTPERKEMSLIHMKTDKKGGRNPGKEDKKKCNF